MQLYTLHMTAAMRTYSNLSRNHHLWVYEPLRSVISQAHAIHVSLHELTQDNLLWEYDHVIKQKTSHHNMRLIFRKPNQVCHFSGHNPIESLKISHTRDINFMYHIQYIYIYIYVMPIILFNSFIDNEFRLYTVLMQ